MTDEDVEEIPVCPNCGSSRVRRRWGKQSDDIEPGSYKCWLPEGCGEEFNEPDYRERDASRASGVGGLSSAGRRLVEMDPDELVTDGGQEEPRMPRIAGRLETTRDRLERTKAMLQRTGDDEELEEMVTDALACADAALARALGTDDALQKARTDGGSPELAGEKNRIEGLDGNFYVEIEGVAVEEHVDDVSMELTISDDGAALSVARDAGSDHYVGVLGKLPPEEARELARGLFMIAELTEKPELRTDGGRDGTTKTITGYAVVDWKKGKVRSRKTKPKRSELGNNELLAKLKFDVHVPDVDVPTLAAEIEVPEPMVYSATLEALEDREMPEYAQTADSVITEHVDELQDASHDEIEQLVDSIVVKTLRETRGRPRIELVEEYVVEVVGEIRSSNDQDES